MRNDFDMRSIPCVCVLKSVLPWIPSDEHALRPVDACLIVGVSRTPRPELSASSLSPLPGSHPLSLRFVAMVRLDELIAHQDAIGARYVSCRATDGIEVRAHSRDGCQHVLIR